MRVLFLAFEFPPVSSGGVHRSAKLAKYLPRMGIDLEVVTIHAEDYIRWTKNPLDEYLMGKIPSSVKIHRISSGFPEWFWKLSTNNFFFFLFKWVFWGDPHSLFWEKPLFEKLDELFKENTFDVLLSTAPPFGISVLAKKAADRYKIPWVADWRDTWSLWANAPFLSYLHYWYAKNQEMDCLKRADRSICTSPVTLRDWQEEFHGIDKKKLSVIYNGFDQEEIEKIVISNQKSEKIRFLYIGSFYYEPAQRKSIWTPWWKRKLHQWFYYVRRREDWLYRSPYYFLIGLNEYIKQNPEFRLKLEVVFAGPIPKWLPGMLKETGTDSLAKLLGPISHAKALQLQAESDIMLLTSAKVEGKPDYSIAGKIFEYFGLRKRILAVVTHGAMQDLIKGSGLEIIADPDRIETVVGAIHQAVGVAKTPVSLLPAQEAYIQSFNCENTARQMAEQFKKPCQK